MSAAADKMADALREVVRISDRKHDAWDAAKAALEAYEAEKAMLYSLDADPDGIRARTVHSVLGALAFGAQGNNPPPPGHWLGEIWEIGRLERQLSEGKPNG